MNEHNKKKGLLKSEVPLQSMMSITTKHDKKRFISILAGVGLLSMTAVGISSPASAVGVGGDPGKNPGAPSIGGQKLPGLNYNTCNVGLRKAPKNDAKLELKKTIESLTKTYRGEVYAAHKAFGAAKETAYKTLKAALKVAGKDNEARELAYTAFLDSTARADEAYWTAIDTSIAKYETASDAAFATYYNTAATPSDAAARAVCRKAVSDAGAVRRAAVRTAHTKYVATINVARAEYKKAVSVPDVTVDQIRTARDTFHVATKEARKELETSKQTARKAYHSSVKAANEALKSALTPLIK